MLRKFFVVTMFICLAAPAEAALLNLDTLPSHVAGGYYVGPVGGYLDGGSRMGFVCDDFAHTTYIPSTFEVNINTIPSLTYARFGNDAVALFKYQEAAWLMLQMDTHPSDIASLQYAVWNVFNSSAPDYETSNAWLALAAAIDPSRYDFSGVRIYTPTGRTGLSNQEFMSGSISVVPEPCTLLLVGFGILGLKGAKRRI